MAQERIDDWWKYARKLVKAERKLKIEHWVFISIEYKDADGHTRRLHSYDFSRELHEKYRCVVRWREGRLHCFYLRETVSCYYCYYDKRTRVKTGFNSCLSKLAAAKAQITIAERKEKEYLDYQRQNNLFFDEQTDEELMNFRNKLQTKKEKYVILSEQIKTAVEKH